MKQRILCTVDRAMGFGDAMMLHSVIKDLSELYDLRIICPDKSFSCINLYCEQYGVECFSVTTQPKFYTNDYYCSLNLIYWDIYNNLRNLPNHAINCMRKLANLDLYNKDDYKILPTISISNHILDKINTTLSSLPKPIILVHPLISYYNKMIDDGLYYDIVSKVRDLGTVIQIGTPVRDSLIHPKAINLIGKTSLAETLALIKFADLVFCGDTFVQHAAALMKTPAVVYFCGTTPMDFGYPFFSNIFNPELVPCQLKCGRPLRWLYDYTYSDLNNWNSRNETGWVCPTKYCSSYITSDLILNLIEKELKIGKDRDWSFYPIEVSDYMSCYDDYRRSIC